MLRGVLRDVTSPLSPNVLICEMGLTAPPHGVDLNVEDVLNFDPAPGM